MHIRTYASAKTSLAPDGAGRATSGSLIRACCGGLSGILVVMLCCSGMIAPAYAKLIYDEEKGIIFQESEKREKKKSRSSQAAQRPPQMPSKPKFDLHMDRKSDPPDEYFVSGLKYFNDSNYTAALKNFSHAASMNNKAKYQLWIGKTHRALGNDTTMIEIMHTIIKKWPDAEVADDALFELAYYYQQEDAFARAQKLYTRLVEEYPFGRSFSNNQRYREFAEKQITHMHGKTAAMLHGLGYDTSRTLTEMIKAAQKDMGLAQDGRLTRETITGLAARYVQKLKKEKAQKESAGSPTDRRYLVLSLIAAAVFMMLMLQLLILRKKAQRLSTMEMILDESDVSL